MRLTLDWDSPEEKEAHFEDAKAFVSGESGLGRFTENGTASPWELRQSSMGDGYHFVAWDAVSNWGDLVGARDDLGDDSKRLKLDLMRRQRGSPFLQVLYSRKYMERWGWKPETGEAVETLEGVKHVPEPDRVKEESGSLNYPKIAEILASEEYFGTITATAEELGFARSTVSGWIRGEHEPSSPARSKLRRRARSRGIGHYVETEGGGKSADELPEIEIEYFDPEEKDHRRTIVEYISVPWADDEEQIKKNTDSDKGSEERLLNVHTGTWNDNHETGQLKYIHDQVEEHAREVLSPANHGNDLPQLDLDRINQISREFDSVNFEDELLDPDETDWYLSNTRDRVNEEQLATELNLEQLPIFEVILWDEDMTGILWHVIGVWTGESVRDATILSERVLGNSYGDDNAGWW
jgi:predicted transcriptional regulator